VAVDVEDTSAMVATLAKGGEHLAITCDVGVPEQIAAAAKQVLARLGRCDIFVNNAAILPITELETMTSELWQRVQAVNVEPLVLFAQAFVPAMAEAGWGRIVSTGSSVTLHPQTRDIAYMTSKGSIHALTRALANELGDLGITVNAIAPTVVKTEGFVARTPAGGPSADDMMQRIVSQQTIKRACTPKDIANALAFLVSEDADFITGQILHVDGGRTRSGA
jgi:NAD(P)-dependent dehydrogenase (short-subunit alcohol dehydrogenase family)